MVIDWLYVVSIAVYFVIYNVLGWGLNIQFGIAGLLNFTYITFVAAGAYFAGVAALPPARGGISQTTYILGWNLPFPMDMAVGAAAAGLLGVLVGFVALRKLRSDYQAIVTVSVGAVAFVIVSNNRSLFNGSDGIQGVPRPLDKALGGLDDQTFQYVFLALITAIALVLWWIAYRVHRSPYGRILRAIRDDEDAVASLGKNVYRYKMSAFVLGSVYAGIGGAMFIEFIGTWNPSGWGSAETFLIFSAVIVGGRGNNLGVVVGALLIPILFTEATRYIPAIPGQPNLISSLRGLIIGVLVIGTMWWRPQGILPERRRRFTLPLVPTASRALAEEVGA